MPYLHRMTTKQAIAYFGSITELARALHIQPPAVHQWGKYPPSLRQWEIEAATDGALKREKARAG